mmetsp:Transcript_27693/g.81381  ORF Transcript_27693/g.81381 Transcript_27693/m.81381 type:complete len:849 (-) Transcript_27693:39-2585(-)
MPGDPAIGEPPTPPMSPYDFFVRSVRDAYCKGSRQSISDVLSLPPELELSLAGRWNLIGDKAREGYDRMASADRERYAKELESWKDRRAGRYGRSQNIVMKGRIIERVKVQEVGRRRKSVGKPVGASEGHANYIGPSNEPPKLVKATRGSLGITARVHPRRLDLAVVNADCPDLNTEFVSVDRTSTIAEFLKILENLYGSIWSTGFLEDSSTKRLELLGLVVGHETLLLNDAENKHRGLENESTITHKDVTTTTRTRRRNEPVESEEIENNFQDEDNASIRANSVELRGGAKEDVYRGTAYLSAYKDINAGNKRQRSNKEFFSSLQSNDDEEKRNTGEYEENGMDGSDGDMHNDTTKDRGEEVVTTTGTTLDISGPPPKKKRRQTRSFDERLEELRQYKVEHGNCDVPMREGNLGEWVKALRLSYKYLKAGGKQTNAPSYCRVLTDNDQIEKLNALGFRWMIKEQKKRVTFEESLEKYIRLRSEAGIEEYIQDKFSRVWAARMRREYKNFREGKQADMTAERINALEEADFSWKTPRKVPSMFGEDFDKYVAKLRMFREKWGPKPVSETRDKDLHSFVQKCRSQYRQLKLGGSTWLTWERIKQLSDEGIHFENVVAEGNHEQIMVSFRQFKQDHGHLNISLKHPTLGKWVGGLRLRYRLLQQGKASTLTAEHIEDLEGLGFNFDGEDAKSHWLQEKFGDKIQELLRYKEETGSCEGHPQLRNWIKQMRHSYRSAKKGKEGWKHRHAEEQFQRLVEIGVQLEVPSSQNVKTFEERLEELREYKELHGNFNGLGARKNKSLYRWVFRIREKYALWREGQPTNLTSEQLEQLHSIGFNFENSSTILGTLEA